MATIIRNQNLFCTCCGAEYKIQYPISIPDFATATNIFDGIHKKCKQTWVEPEADQGKSVEEKARWWMANGERGMSSETMWHYFTATSHQKAIQQNQRISFPYDPDDFSRCYKLLQAVPEWKARIPELKTLCPEWERLADNWETLTMMYEANVATEWKDCKRIGMGDLMEKIIENKL